MIEEKNFWDCSFFSKSWKKLTTAEATTVVWQKQRGQLCYIVGCCVEEFSGIWEKKRIVGKLAKVFFKQEAKQNFFPYHHGFDQPETWKKTQALASAASEAAAVYFEPLMKTAASDVVEADVAVAFLGQKAKAFV